MKIFYYIIGLLFLGAICYFVVNLPDMKQGENIPVIYFKEIH